MTDLLVQSDTERSATLRHEVPLDLWPGDAAQWRRARR